MSKDADSRAVERRAAEAYRRFAPVARAYRHVFSRSAVTAGAVPTVLFLGNHSSGKSSLVNWILGGAPVQDTGIAPTDDGFTVIAYGDRERDVNGPAAVAELPAEYGDFAALGATFLEHLRVRFRNREILKRVTLVDSPGMIDAAEGTARRSYDFFAAVRRFAVLSDLVFFLFDPEKPGTTGEAVESFSRCLDGLSFKLRVLLNKCDTLAGLYDFARTYGTLCWNLARVLRTKDMPKIYLTYTGDGRAAPPGAPDGTDIERHRAEFRAVFDDLASRRADNLHAAARSDFAQLAVRMRVLNGLAARVRAARLLCWAVGIAFVLVSALPLTFLVATRLGADLAHASFGSVVSWTVGAIVAASTATVSVFLARILLQHRRAVLAETADAAFAQTYRRALADGRGDDVRQNWDAVRAGVAEAIRDASLKLPLRRGRWYGRVRETLAAFSSVRER